MQVNTISILSKSCVHASAYINGVADRLIYIFVTIKALEAHDIFLPENFECGVYNGLGAQIHSEKFGITMEHLLKSPNSLIEIRGLDTNIENVILSSVRCSMRILFLDYVLIFSSI